MSVVNDLREVLQDVVTPDIKAMKVELAHLKERVAAVEARFGQMETKFGHLESKFGHLDDSIRGQVTRIEDSVRGQLARAEEDARRRHEDVMAAVRMLLDVSELKQRMDQLERRTLPSPTGQ